jgi:hypothetical protein
MIGKAFNRFSYYHISKSHTTINTFIAYTIRFYISCDNINNYNIHRFCDNICTISFCAKGEDNGHTAFKGEVQ